MRDVFVPYVEAVRQEWHFPSTQPAALVTDGHVSRFSQDTFALLYIHHIRLVILPAHTSAVTQPLDVGCFASLKRQFPGELRRQIALAKGHLARQPESGEQVTQRRGPGRPKKVAAPAAHPTRISPADRRTAFLSALEISWASAACIFNAVTAFETAGLHPFNPDKPKQNAIFKSMEGISLGERARARKDALGQHIRGYG